VSTVAITNVWRFERAANAYKALYLLAMIANWALLFFTGAPHLLENPWLCFAWLAVFIANGVGWYGRSHRYVWGLYLEKGLSVGRMVMIIVMALFDPALAALFSPVGAVWGETFEAIDVLKLPSTATLLSIFAVLFWFEAFHYMWLRSMSRATLARGRSLAGPEPIPSV